MNIDNAFLLHPDFIHLQLDGNGTVVLGDTAKKVDAFINRIARAVKAQWSENTSIMSYKDYVQDILIPGDRYEPTIRKQQEKKLGEFLDYLQESQHPSYEKAFTLYQELKNKYSDSETLEIKFNIFPSILTLIDKIKEICPFSITIRTFGNDGDIIAEEFASHGIKISQRATMVAEGMQFEGETEVKRGAELLKTVQVSHTVVQDQFKRWSSNHRKGAHGKIIPCTEDANFEGQKFLTIFLDDNLSKISYPNNEKMTLVDPEEENIALPQDIYNRPISWHSKGIIALRINPVKAALDSNYMVEKLNKQLAKRGFKIL